MRLYRRIPPSNLLHEEQENRRDTYWGQVTIILDFGSRSGGLDEVLPSLSLYPCGGLWFCGQGLALIDARSPAELAGSGAFMLRTSSGLGEGALTWSRRSSLDRRKRGGASGRRVTKDGWQEFPLTFPRPWGLKRRDWLLFEVVAQRWQLDRRMHGSVQVGVRVGVLDIVNKQK
jgi:hypothetical protein